MHKFIMAPSLITHSEWCSQTGLTNAEQITLDEILKDEKLQAENNYVQVSETVEIERRWKERRPEKNMVC